MPRELCYEEICFSPDVDTISLQTRDKNVDMLLSAENQNNLLSVHRRVYLFLTRSETIKE